ncbi:MAG: 4-hydroxybenzoate octaprenyltransferase [Gammaproteobacteria bacterium]
MIATLRQSLALIRFHKPVGTLLLLWPTLWALVMASKGLPDLKFLGLFVLGTFLMRSAGCVINDWADQDFDRQVARTKARPLAAQVLSSKTALAICLGLILAAYYVVLQCNLLTIELAFLALFLALAYPFMKRFTYFPQLVLGLAFSTSILLAAAAVLNSIPAWAYVLFFANTVWVLSYDSIYSILDLEDDLKIGLKSPAVYFGRKRVNYFIALIQILFFITLLIIKIDIGILFLIGIILIYQQYLILSEDISKIYFAFSSNNIIGLLVLVGIILSSEKCNF